MVTKQDGRRSGNPRSSRISEIIGHTFATSFWGVRGLDGENSGAVEDKDVFETEVPFGSE